MPISGHVLACSIALAVAVLCYVFSIGALWREVAHYFGIGGLPIFPGNFVCLITMPVGLAFVRTTPRLAIATVYWSAAALLVGARFLMLPDWLWSGLLMAGTVLGLLMYWNYRDMRHDGLVADADERMQGFNGQEPGPRPASGFGIVSMRGRPKEARQEPVEGIEAVTDTQPAQWFVDGLEPDWSVCTCVPRGFEAYARIFHPAWRLRLEEGVVVREPVTWAAVAAVTGRTVHRRMQWRQIIGRGRPEEPIRDQWLADGETVFDDPDEGTLPQSVATRLCEILLPHTQAPEACRFGVWIGFAWEYRAGIPETNSIAGPYREWDLFRAPLDTMQLCFFETHIEHQSANVVWPPDRTWCVATDIDRDSTYVGGSAELISAIVGSQTLEAFEVQPDDELGADGINPLGPPLARKFEKKAEEKTSDTAPR